MLFTSAFSKDNSDISLGELNVFTTATRKLGVNVHPLAESLSTW